jgi:hypothetical protein
LKVAPADRRTAHDQEDQVAGFDPHVLAGMLDRLTAFAVDLDDEESAVPAPLRLADGKAGQGAAFTGRRLRDRGRSR